MKHPSQRRYFRMAGTLGGLLALSGCTRASAPPPPSDATAAPATSVPPVAVPPAASSAPAPMVAPSAASSVASVPPPTAASTAPDNPWLTPRDCSKVEASAEHRERVVSTCNVKEEFRSFVAARQSCSAAHQCAVVPGACPFGCFVPVAEASASEVAAKLKELGAQLDQLGNRCIYRCMSPPTAVCVEGRCATGMP